MNLFKRIAKKILAEEFKQLTDEIGESKGKLEEYQNLYLNATNKLNQLSSDKSLIEIECQKLKKENETLRKYYELDKEPSDEIKAKMHIDLEINRLKEEKLLLEMKNLYQTSQLQPLYYLQPYLNGVWGRWF